MKLKFRPARNDEHMKVLTLNCGSSSVKYSIWSMPSKEVLCSGTVERVTLGNSFIKHKKSGQDEVTQKQDCPNHEVAIELIIKFLRDRESGVIVDLSEIDAVGHRVTHGGEKFVKSAIINDGVIKSIEDCAALAPLHNPPQLAGIRAAMKLMPNIPHVSVFDTAFLATMPPQSYIYGIPYEWYEKYKIRRYGFHGTSHLYVSKRAAVLLGKKPQDVNLVTLHIGNGVSVTAIKKGLAHDHSMGFTPIEGAIMGTRSGDLDAGIIFHIMRLEKILPEQMENILQKKSGLLGVTGKYADRRDIQKAAEEGDFRAKLAIEIECHRLRKYIGAYIAAMGGADAVVFTAGVGENAPMYREKICEGLQFMGLKVDAKKNAAAVGGKSEVDISTSDSSIKVFVIPTREELVIVEDVVALLENRYDVHTNFEYSFQK